MRAARRLLWLGCLLLVPLLGLFLIRATGHAQSVLNATSPIIVPFADVPKARGVTIDGAGNLFSLNLDTGTIYKITPAGQVSTLADLPDITGGYIGPTFDPASGNLFVAKYALGSGNQVLKITPAGVVSVFAVVAAPAGLAADGQGNLFVTSYVCSGSALYKISAAGVVNQFGTGLCYPDGVAIGPNGDLFVGDRGTQRIMRIPAAGGAATVFATGFMKPIAVAFDQAGTLFVANYTTGTLVSVNPNGVVSPFVSGLNLPVGLAFDQQDQLYIANSGTNQIVRIENSPVLTPTSILTPTYTPTSALTPTLTSTAMPTNTPTYTPTSTLTPTLTSTAMPTNAPTNTPASTPMPTNTPVPTSTPVPTNTLTIIPIADVPKARGVTIDGAGNLYSLGLENGVIYKITPAGLVSTIADLPDIFEGYIGPVFDPASGNLFVSKYAQPGGNEVLKITPAGVVSVFAAGIEGPSGLAADGQGNLFVISFTCPGGAVYKITAAGVVSLFGTGLCHPDGVAIGPNGDLFIGDRGTQRIMRVPAAGGEASVFAVGVGIPLGVAFDRNDTLFVADYSTGTISSVNANGVVSLFASGLNLPTGLVFDQQNQLYVANSGTNQIVRLENQSPTAPPIAERLTINGGALTTTAANVRLDVSASNANSSQVGLSMSFSNDGVTWSAWQNYAPSTLWQLTGGSGVKTVYGRFKNSAGVISSTVSDTITRDMSVQSEYSVTINNGALYTNKVAVQLTISARPQTAEMQVSNDGGFTGAVWEPYSAQKAWQITNYHNHEITRLVYVRFRDVDGNVSSLYVDDIILDLDAPHGHVSNTGHGALLNLTATDDLSGVDSMRASAQADFGGASWEPFSTRLAWDFGNSSTVYVQFRDVAGNLSPSYAIAQGGSLTVFLPLVLH